MTLTRGLSKEGKKIYNSSDDIETMKQLLSEEDFKKLDENIKKKIKKIDELVKVYESFQKTKLKSLYKV